jgi:hypothetical protein
MVEIRGNMPDLNAWKDNYASCPGQGSRVRWDGVFDCTYGGNLVNEMDASL